MPKASEVFSLLIQQMRAEIERVRDEGAELLRAGDYDKAQEYIQRAAALEAQVREAEALHHKWVAILEGRFKPRQPSRRTSRRREAIIARPLLRAAILTALREAGGTASSAEVLERVYELIGSKFPPEAHERDGRGQMKWRRRAHTERAYMVRDGLIAPDTPPGIWKITPDGLQWLEENELSSLPEMRGEANGQVH